MASPPEIPQIQDSNQFRTYVSVFLDLLGLGQELEMLGRLSEHDITSQEFRTSSAKLLMNIHRFRSNGLEFWERLNAEPSGVLGELRAEQSELLKRAREHNAIIQFFADTLIVSIPLQGDNRQATWRALEVAVGVVAMTHITCMVREKILRGGIDLGVGTVLYKPPYDHEIIGACVSRAYAAEKSAKFPRVILGDHARRFLSDMAMRSDSLGGSQYDRSSAQAVLERFATDPDDHRLFVDFLSPYYLNMIRETGVTAIRESVSRVIDQGLALAKSGHEAGRQRSLMEKFQWLERYARSRSMLTDAR